MWRIEKGGAMKVILRDNIENLGKRGDIVNVARGYGRNYLIPKKLALEVTPSNMKMVEQQQKALRKKLEKEVKTFQAEIEKINQIQLSFARKAGDKDSIFGSVSVADIAKALEEKGFDIEKKKILLAEPIKRLGTYKIPVKVFHDDRAEITLEVTKEGSEEGPVKAKKKAAPMEPTPEPEKTQEPVEEKKTVEPDVPEEEKPDETEIEATVEEIVPAEPKGEVSPEPLPETTEEKEAEDETEAPAEPVAKEEPAAEEKSKPEPEPEPEKSQADE
jgi:large subunit ribosomal protein L9